MMVFGRAALRYCESIKPCSDDAIFWACEILTKIIFSKLLKLINFPLRSTALLWNRFVYLHDKCCLNRTLWCVQRDSHLIIISAGEPIGARISWYAVVMESTRDACWWCGGGVSSKNNRQRRTQSSILGEIARRRVLRFYVILGVAREEEQSISIYIYIYAWWALMGLLGFLFWQYELWWCRSHGRAMCV